MARSAHRPPIPRRRWPMIAVARRATGAEGRPAWSWIPNELRGTLNCWWDLYGAILTCRSGAEQVPRRERIHGDMLSFTARIRGRCGNREVATFAIAGRQPLAVNAGLVKLVLIDAFRGRDFRMNVGIGMAARA